MKERNSFLFSLDVTRGSGGIGMSFVVIALALVVAPFVVGILVAIAGAFRRHDPSRARASAEVGPDGRFELVLPSTATGTIWFRFEIDGDTDADYDLLIRGEVESAGGAKRAFALRTHEHSTLEGAATARDVQSTYAVSTSSGSVELAVISPDDRVVRGLVTAWPASLLNQGHVYLP